MLDEALLLMLLTMRRRRHGSASNRSLSSLLALMISDEEDDLSENESETSLSSLTSSSSSDEELFALSTVVDHNKKRARKATEANSSSTGSPVPTLGPEDIDIVDTDIKLEENDIEETPAKRLKTEHIEPSETPAKRLKTEHIDPSVTSEPCPVVKEEPVDAPDFVDPTSVTPLLPGSLGVAIKREPEDPAECGSSSANFQEVCVTEEADLGIKQEVELP
ncbi:unnamed protein product [Acanthoscelides obtectus]|uniref:Uncharacterized protein n=1 Tax=Acanthoscelides obtectus TaxID=200917 RepID=A0A9P0MAP6_ACAOB|nr:unnamed protein product [Acanthoscelides obtectus]CAK1664511.1 hypothetical protein AOBTE_LOCUS24302 [Acanthoscelides obtectus]